MKFIRYILLCAVVLSINTYAQKSSDKWIKKSIPKLQIANVFFDSLLDSLLLKSSHRTDTAYGAFKFIGMTSYIDSDNHDIINFKLQQYPIIHANAYGYLVRGDYLFIIQDDKYSKFFIRTTDRKIFSYKKDDSDETKVNAVFDDLPSINFIYSNDRFTENSNEDW